MRDREVDAWVAVILLAALFIVLTVVVGPKRAPTPHPGLDACVTGDSTSMVPEAWLIETRAQRDSLYEAAWDWRDSAMRGRTP